MNELFADSNNTVTGGANQLHKTGELTSVATTIANRIMEMINENDDLKPQVSASINSHDAMDDLINSLYPLTTVDVEFLKTEDTATIEKMIRSQQSKRSRSKGKIMTIDAYRTMMIGAIGENLLRLAANMPKQSGGGGLRETDVIITDEELQAFAADQEKLARELRNIQSKKSIAKSKANFDENSKRWQQLLVAEQQLKSVRIGGRAASSAVTTKAVETQSEIKNLLEAAGDDLSNMKAADAKDLLKSIAEMLSK